MLAHNASLNRVPFEMGRLVDAPLGDPYVETLAIVTDSVGRVREEAQRKAEVAMNARK